MNSQSLAIAAPKFIALLGKLEKLSPEDRLDSTKEDYRRDTTNVATKLQHLIVGSRKKTRMDVEGALQEVLTFVGDKGSEGRCEEHPDGDFPRRIMMRKCGRCATSFAPSMKQSRKTTITRSWTEPAIWVNSRVWGRLTA